MTNRPDIPVNVVNGQDLTRLRAELKHPTKAGVKKVAQQFESIFIGMMLKSMRQATQDDPLFSGPGTRQYRGLYDQQLAMSMAKRGGFGIAKMVEGQMMRNAGLDHSAKTPLDPSISAYRADPVERARVIAPAAQTGGTPNPSASTASRGHAAQWASPSDFVRSILPAAKRAAARIGVDPRAIVAQAALETGWGQHVMTGPHGKSSFNLFGIKAGAGWTGNTVTAPTTEYRNGTAGPETAQFRAYDSVQACVDDYAQFLQSHPRYQKALSAGDVAAFSKALQQAGYATDPNYARKIQGIAHGGLLQSALSTVGNGVTASENT